MCHNHEKTIDDCHGSCNDIQPGSLHRQPREHDSSRVNDTSYITEHDSGGYNCGSYCSADQGLELRAL